MRYEIELTDTAKRHYQALPPRWRRTAKEGIETHLRHAPGKVSRSRIKRLRRLERPEYRLRLDPYRVFYDVAGRTVLVLAIVPKDNTAEWLAEHGIESL